MEVVTDSPNVKKAQDGMLEFLLVNHPLDCPVCDKGGECPLQDQTMAYGPGETRFVEEKRHWDKPTPLSPLVLIDRERCIQCARCTRFAEEVAGDASMDFASRSDSTEVAIYPGQPFTSNFSGNVVQICPVGALLAKPYRFKARPWDLEQVESTCTYCAVGCRVAVQSSSDQVVRFIGVDSDPVNWGWLCDKGRFGFEALNSPERLAHPLLRVDGELRRASWPEAMSAVAARLAGVPGDRAGVLGGARLPNEDAYAWAKLARTVLRTGNIDAQLGDGLPAELVAGLPRATIDQACKAALVVTLAPDLKEELPVLYLRLRHAALEDRVQVVELSPAATGLSSLAAQRLRYRPGELMALVQAICGESPITSETGGVSAEVAELARGAISEASRRGRPGAPPAIVVVLGRPSLAEPSSAVSDAARVLATLPGVAFLPALRRSNVHGAIDLGLAPGLLPGRVGLEEGRRWYEHKWGTELAAGAGLDALGMLTAAANGTLDGLVLVGSDPLADFPDKDLAARALERAGFVVAVDAFMTTSAAQADVVLPAAIYTERRGSFTNLEGRVTWLGQKVTAPGTARPDWMIAADLASRLGGDLGLGSLEEIWAEIAQVSPLHQGVPQALLVSRQGRNGVVVPLGLEASAPEGATVPPPLDPMADPGIYSAETHPAPPEPWPAAGVDVRRADAPGTGARTGRDAAGADDGGPSLPAMLQLHARSEGRSSAATAAQASPRSSKRAARQPAKAAGPGGEALRLVTTRPMWDGGTMVQRSPSLSALHPRLELRANPDDLAWLGLQPGGMVRAKSQRGEVVVPLVADNRVPAGVAVLPFNLPDGGAVELIDGAAPLTEVHLEKPQEPGAVP